MSANLGNAILRLVFTVILANFIHQGRCGRWKQTREDHTYYMPEHQECVCHLLRQKALYLVLNVKDHFREGRSLLPRTLLFIFTRKCSQHSLGFSMYLLPPFRRKYEKQTLLAQNKWPLMSNEISWEAEAVFK